MKDEADIVVLQETELQPGKVGTEVDARGKDDPKPYPNSAGGTGDADDGKEKHGMINNDVPSPPLPLARSILGQSKNEWCAHRPCAAHGHGGHLPATSCAGASSVFTRERHPAANPPYSWCASVSSREDPTSPHISDTQTGTKVSGAPDTCSRRLTDGEPAKVKLGHEVGKCGKPSASFADGAEGKRIPPGGGGRRRDSARNPRPWAARCAGGLNADSEFRTLGHIPKRKSSLPTSVGTPCGPEGRIRLPAVIPLNGEDRVRAEWDASEAMGRRRSADSHLLREYAYSPKH
jgi:hypothetical protein